MAVHVKTWAIVAAAPGLVALVLAASNVNAPPGWYHIVGLVGFFGVSVTFGAGLLVWLANRVWRSQQTVEWTEALDACKCK